MYSFVDRPVEHLDNSGRFLLWAMRGWVAAATRGACPPQQLHRGFAAVNARLALPDFHVAMALIASDGRECLTLAPMPCCRIAEDEAVLLSLWRDAACDETAALRATLALLIDPASVAPIARAMAGTVTQLTAAGFDLSPLFLLTRNHQES